MERPASIVTFERCYLGAWIVGLINTALNWNRTVTMMAANPATTQMGPGFGTTMLAGGLVIGAAITLVLWYFVAKRGSVVAKWIVTVLFAFGLISFLWSLAMARISLGVSGIIGVVTMVLQAIAVFMLFRPDTKAWFGETPVEPGETPLEPIA